MAEPSIQDVSDTAFWVAYYRDRESARPDALFHDPYAGILLDERGKKISESMPETSRYTSWSVVVRTCIIDALIEEWIAKGVEIVVNLGAGLDARPYRMNLPSQLRWFEVDYPHIVKLKNERLASEKPRCQLERVALDLADRSKRQAFFAELNSRAKNILILTEGVLPYLQEKDIAALAEDLLQQRQFRYWIADYYAPQIYAHLRSRKRQRQMKNAPIVFFPKDWFQFFEDQGWRVDTMRYLSEESLSRGRTIPMPLIMKLISFFIPKKILQKNGRFAGYAVLVPHVRN